MARNSRLAHLKTRLQQKLQAQTFFEDKIAPFAELFSVFGKSGVGFQVAAWVGLKEEWHPHLVAKMQELPYGFKMEGNNKSVELLDDLFVQYPSLNALRYVPPIEKMEIETSENPLRKIMEHLQLEDTEVYVYFLRYAPLLQMKLYDIFRINQDEMFNFWLGDVVIFPKDKAWLIAYSLEEEWYAALLRYGT